MEKKPRITIILPTHNRGYVLPEAIDSVCAQTCRDWEMILVLDSCTDNTREVLAPYLRSDNRIRMIETNVRSVAAARNAALSEVKGEYIALLDDDDIWRPDKLERQLELMEKNPEVAVCFTDGTLFEGRETLKTGLVAKNNPYLSRWMENCRTTDLHFYKGSLLEALLFVNCIVISTALMRRTMTEKIGGFDPVLKGCEGYDYWLRVATQYPMGFLDRVTADYRLTEAGYMGSMEARSFVTRECDSIVLDHYFANVPEQLRPKVSKRIAEISAMAGWYFWKKGESNRARRLFRRSLKYKKIQPKSIAYLLLSYLLREKSADGQRKTTGAPSSLKKILVLLPSLPLPANSGGQMRSMNFLKCLSRRGEVTLLCPGSEEKDSDSLAGLRAYCREIHLLNPDQFGPHSRDQQKKSLMERLSSFFRRQPWILRDFLSEELREKLLGLNLSQYDFIFIRYPMLAHYFFQDRELSGFNDKVIVDADDILPLMQERRARGMKAGYGKWRHLQETSILKRYYRNLKKMKAVLATSERDRNYLKNEKMAKNVFIVPNIIETAVKGKSEKIQKESHEILFCGSLSFVHNEEAVLYFCDHVFPKIRKQIPEVVFTVIGKNPTPKIHALSSRAGVSIVGPVDWTEPYYRRAALAVVPLLNGAGTRIKVLEAMAYGVPVVATSIGAEGIDVTPGKDILIADAPDDMAQKCVNLLKHDEQRALLSRHGKELIERKYDMRAFESVMDRILSFSLAKNATKEKETGLSLSIIICTYNRAESLNETLASLACQQNRLVKDCEILVVDNNSHDHTKLVAEQYSNQKELKVRYLFEPRQGVAYARNLGLRHAKGDIVAFLDDDVIAEPGWLNALWKCFAQTDADAVGGRISQKWYQDRPEWFSDELNGCLISQEFGAERKRWQDPRRHFVTANMAFHRRVFDQYGCFRNDLGRRGESLLGGEDRELYQRLIKEGRMVYYEPQARVFHKVEPERLTKDYFRRWYSDIGKTLGHEIRPKSSYLLTIAPLWLWKRLLNVFSRWIRASLFKKTEAERFASEIWTIHYRAMMLERFFHWLPFGFGERHCAFRKNRFSMSSPNGLVGAPGFINDNKNKETKYEYAKV